jgi:hypothetical protein
MKQQQRIEPPIEQIPCRGWLHGPQRNPFFLFSKNTKPRTRRGFGYQISNRID